ncbi:MAG: hypothetical protein ACK551_02185 [Vampirovibrionales bacterium]
MTLSFPSLNLGSPASGLAQETNALEMQALQYTQARPQMQAPAPQVQADSLFRSGLPVAYLPTQFTNTVGSFAPPLPQKVSYMFVAPATGQQSMSGGSSGQQQRR